MAEEDGAESETGAGCWFLHLCVGNGVFHVSQNVPTRHDKVRKLQRVRRFCERVSHYHVRGYNIGAPRYCVEYIR